MRSSFAYRDAALRTIPGYRQGSRRRRLAVVCAVLGLALASGVIGSLTRPDRAAVTKPTLGPFSYIPSQ